MALAMFEKTFWIVGGACTGKSTLASAICESMGYKLIDMDARIYGTWLSVYRADRYPENYRWIQQSNALEWALQQSDEEYLRHCERVSQEYFRLLVIELDHVKNPQRHIVDGGFSSLTAWVGDIEHRNIICLDVDRDLAVSEWNVHPKRVEFKHEILALPRGEKKWIRFLELDALISSQLVKQANIYGVPVIHARQVESVETLVGQVVELWALNQ